MRLCTYMEYLSLSCRIGILGSFYSFGRVFTRLLGHTSTLACHIILRAMGNQRGPTRSLRICWGCAYWIIEPVGNNICWWRSLPITTIFRPVLVWYLLRPKFSPRKKATRGVCHRPTKWRINQRKIRVLVKVDLSLVGVQHATHAIGWKY